jgi:hypothetical protein
VRRAWSFQRDVCASDGGAWNAPWPWTSKALRFVREPNAHRSIRHRLGVLLGSVYDLSGMRVPALANEGEFAGL